MRYLVKVFRLSIKLATIKGHTHMVRRWTRDTILGCECKTKKEAFNTISAYLSVDKKMNTQNIYKYTLQCIKGDKNGKR